MTQNEQVDITVVVVTWQGAHLLRACLDSLRGQTISHRVLVVDNDSSDGTADLLSTDYPDATVLRLPRNVGFAGGIAAALEVVDTRFVALLNNDATASSTWLEVSSRHLQEHGRAAAVTAKMLLAAHPERLNNAGVLLLSSGYGADRGLDQIDGPPYDTPAEVFGFSGGAVVLRTLAARAVGGMEASFFLYYEDTDLSWRLQLGGWQVHYCPDAEVLHQHAASTDPGSRRFAYYNERNRLLTLIRCAPLGLVARCLARFVVTTVSLLAKKVRRSAVPPASVFSVRLRLQVLTAVLGRLGPTLLARWRIGRQATIPRAVVARRWSGTQSRAIDPQ